MNKFVLTAFLALAVQGGSLLAAIPTFQMTHRPVALPRVPGMDSNVATGGAEIAARTIRVEAKALVVTTASEGSFLSVKAADLVEEGKSAFSDKADRYHAPNFFTVLIRYL
ncbi:hypothetical protein [Glaciimonas immobilis]|uniref:Uncharacterized protein n=1 Tax=Glaciimonas immobilis TaxID=728004 RepID=A0A840RRS2_9BURK|nr:hypothetical protein [Glaciimonas immobilis]KAF3998017.1 hypothetical protein HAV38_10675 [Glaciimonas immobilis]MBB5199301.1 hypothetical protein [Glaciimonas immobilis]